MKMQIELKDITVRELVEGYCDDGEGGVVGYGGKLDIRPPYQREFVYKDEKRDAVIDTIIKGFPLNVMYWAVREDGTFEVIDGQQRTISIAQYVQSDFSINGRFFHNLTTDEQGPILNYKLMVYACTGTESEKLKWFKTVNIAGEELSNQELKNAVYAGSWVSDAKRYFSRNGCVASKIGSDYLKGAANRQEYLETAIKWISNGRIEEYMGKHQNDKDATELWNYFRTVIDWIERTFMRRKNRKKFMKGVDWGPLHSEFKDDKLDTKKIEEEINELILDDDVTNDKGIYPYVLTRDQKYLNIRAFTDKMKLKVFEKQSGICAKCSEKCEIEEMEADHITPWIEGGKTNEENCQMLCKKCNRTKSSK